MTMPAPALFPTAATARTTAGHPLTALTVVLLIVVIAGVLAVAYDLSAGAPRRPARSGAEPPPADPTTAGDGQLAPSPVKERS